MNPIQKLWLKALEPLSYVINEKMAKRSGKYSYNNWNSRTISSEISRDIFIIFAESFKEIFAQFFCY